MDSNAVGRSVACRPDFSAEEKKDRPLADLGFKSFFETGAGKDAQIEDSKNGVECSDAV